METAEQILPHLNASLNATSAVLLVVGYRLIKRGRETAHKRAMLAAFAVSTLFLICYLVFHFVVKQGEMRRFPEDYPTVRAFYLGVLLTHTILAAAVPFLAITTIYFGLRDRRRVHRRLAKWTFPIWLYVSVTGVVVYLMLYQFFPPQ